ncbi:MAG: sensor histidine kinase N-terminal domain-containing protein [Burkholderiales bacterium]|nr:sensor histidine kinase N-terminal domain-containing protein [Burkholderiales bacterium]
MPEGLRKQPARRDVPARRSLRSQLLYRLLPPILVLFAISGAVAYVVARHHANEVQDHWLVDSAEALAQRVKLSRGEAVLDLPEAARQILQWDTQDATWYALHGQRSGHLAGHPMVPGRPLTGVERLRDAWMYDAGIAGARVRVAAVPVRLEGATEPIEVRVAETLRKRQLLATEMILSVLIPQIALAIVACGVIWYTLRQLLSPIGQVARALEVQTHHSLEPVDDRALPAEVAPLTQSVNDLLARLQDALAAQRHFIADAAHQLRTPLTALKLHADEAARETDVERLRPLIAEVQLAADRAVRLSNQLLTLARAEPSARIQTPRPFDLRQVVFHAASRWVPRALAAGVDLGFDDTLQARLRFAGRGGPQPDRQRDHVWRARHPSHGVRATRKGFAGLGAGDRRRPGHSGGGSHARVATLPARDAHRINSGRPVLGNRAGSGDRGRDRSRP